MIQHLPGMSKAVGWISGGAGRGTSQKPDPESSQKRKQQDRDFPMIVAQDQRWSPSLTSLCNSA